MTNIGNCCSGRLNLSEPDLCTTQSGEIHLKTNSSDLSILSDAQIRLTEIDAPTAVVLLVGPHVDHMRLIPLPQPCPLLIHHMGGEIHLLVTTLGPFALTLVTQPADVIDVLLFEETGQHNVHDGLL